MEIRWPAREYYIAEIIPDTLPPWIQSYPPDPGTHTTEIANGDENGPFNFGNYPDEFLTFPDRGLEKDVDKTVVEAGGLVTYTLTYTMVEGRISASDTFAVEDDYDDAHMAVVYAAK